MRFSVRAGDWQYNARPQYQLYIWDKETGRTRRSTRGRRSTGAFTDGSTPFATRFETKTVCASATWRRSRRLVAFPVQRDETESRAPMDAYLLLDHPDSAIVVSYGGEICAFRSTRRRPPGSRSRSRCSRDGARGRLQVALTPPRR
jgi:hypothetical protein